mmetsp:Transcript_118509/g.379854  ORF Transcript_118509/g.379854 Transcript_118509/m.379854 type:complete len:206 (+) Transcript_118509:400-1017(+)
MWNSSAYPVEPIFIRQAPLLLAGARRRLAGPRPGARAPEAGLRDGAPAVEQEPAEPVDGRPGTAAEGHILGIGAGPPIPRATGAPQQNRGAAHEGPQATQQLRGGAGEQPPEGELPDKAQLDEAARILEAPCALDAHARSCSFNIVVPRPLRRQQSLHFESCPEISVSRNGAHRLGCPLPMPGQGPGLGSPWGQNPQVSLAKRHP